MNQLQGPRLRQLENLRLWLGDPKGGSNFQSGVEFGTWLGDEQINPALYVSTKSSLAENDMFTNSIMDFISGTFHRKVGQEINTGHVIDKDSRYVSYEDSGIAKMSSVIVTVISSVLPPLTILALNSLTTTTARIGLTVLFTAVFASILGYFSSAKRVEVLVATAT
jgi:hypothetical protein